MITTAGLTSPAAVGSAVVAALVAALLLAVAMPPVGRFRREAGDACRPAELTPALLPRGISGMALLDLRTQVLPVLRETLVAGAPPAAALAASLLGLHGDPRAAPALTVVLSERDGPLEVRRAAAESLGRIGAPQATDALVSALAFATDAALRRAAAEALGRIGDPAGTPALVAGLAASDPDVRAACADALVATGAEGRAWLEQLAAGTGSGAAAAQGALTVRPRHLRAVPR